MSFWIKRINTFELRTRINSQKCSEKPFYHFYFYFTKKRTCCCYFCFSSNLFSFFSALCFRPENDDFFCFFSSTDESRTQLQEGYCTACKLQVNVSNLRRFYSTNLCLVNIVGLQTWNNFFFELFQENDVIQILQVYLPVHVQTFVARGFQMIQKNCNFW